MITFTWVADTALSRSCINYERDLAGGVISAKLWFGILLALVVHFYTEFDLSE